MLASDQERALVHGANSCAVSFLSFASLGDALSGLGLLLWMHIAVEHRVGPPVGKEQLIYIKR